jgi:DNA (cytosine-5)-methyltransferase 1
MREEKDEDFARNGKTELMPTIQLPQRRPEVTRGSVENGKATGKLHAVVEIPRSRGNSASEFYAMRLLDLFCGAGGAAKGYQMAGFDVWGVDDQAQPRYPGKFIQADWQDVIELAKDFDAIHASPPCEHYSQLTPKSRRHLHEDLIGSVRSTLLRLGKPFVIENVPSAKRLLREPFMLCGSMFGLGVQRHRFFEVNFQLSEMLQGCDHAKRPVLISGTHRRHDEPRYEYCAQACRDASGIPWMTRKELDKAIPPAYTEFIGRQLLAALTEDAA